jgi:hypothetical protein
MFKWISWNPVFRSSSERMSTKDCIFVSQLNDRMFLCIRAGAVTSDNSERYPDSDIVPNALEKRSRTLAVQR